MAVAFEELEGSPRLEIGEEGILARRWFRVSWQDWPQLARQLLGFYRVVGGQWVFEPPEPFPGFPNLLVERLVVEPFEPAVPDQQTLSSPRQGTNRYSQSGARVTAEYRTQFDADNRPRNKLPKVPEGTYLTYEIDHGLEALVTPARLWHWDDPPQNPKLAPDEVPAVFIPHTVVKLRWHRVASPPWEAIRALRGCVNAAEFLGSPPESLMFLGAKVKRQFHFFQTGGFWNVEYRFRETARSLSDGTPVGWNHLFKEEPVGGEHWVRVLDSQSRPPYKPADFSALFHFAPA